MSGCQFGMTRTVGRGGFVERLDAGGHACLSFHCA
jgi:hypothetical protein